jgi:hypothetical protein
MSLRNKGETTNEKIDSLVFVYRTFGKPFGRVFQATRGEYRRNAGGIKHNAGSGHMAEDDHGRGRAQDSSGKEA